MNELSDPLIALLSHVEHIDIIKITLHPKTSEVENTTGLTIGSGDITVEVLGNLQTCSRSELIAMVLSMQRETDSLREQIKTLTACGKLSQTLEELVMKSEGWLNCCSLNVTSPQHGTLMELERSCAPSPILAPEVLCDSLIEQRSSTQQECCHKIDDTTSMSETPFYQEVIPAELLERCNTGTTAQKLTNELLRGLYDRDCLASHSISGVINSKRGLPKPALPAHEIHAILRAVQHYFPGKTDSEIKGYIRQKLQNEAKRLKKNPHSAKEPLVGP
ncbi:BEN domain-containing protein 6 isoform X2 [Hoplias malabaricus]|uniref:BEN domain-containing protein 6 isoform X2 n=1 Tax=Hoplias malabaricus TaxID=27720 RepID=UPI0034627B6F